MFLLIDAKQKEADLSIMMSKPYVRSGSYSPPARQIKSDEGYFKVE